MRKRPYDVMCRRMTSLPENRGCVISAIFCRLVRAQKRTEIAGFKPSILSMPKTPMRYDPLDRSATAAPPDATDLFSFTKNSDIIGGINMDLPETDGQLRPCDSLNLAK